MPDLNSTIADVYKSVIPGGMALFIFEELKAFENKFIYGRKFGRLCNKYFYYLYYRLLPKIPYINKLYHILSHGKNKVLSRAEAVGRLYYAGFSAVSENTFNGLAYVLARKDKAPSPNPKPSFYPVITLNRVGLYGEIIKIHKIRSMYPYSEFLQKKVFEENNLTATGKFGDDFRITKPGRVFRKYWIDELPQVIDWLRGDIKLVGIRAMSQHYFSLYPPDYQQLYLQVKPGILSPIFDEKTNGFEDIVRIEMEYLKKYIQHPVLTDFLYFYMIVKDIFTGVRSN